MSKYIENKRGYLRLRQKGGNDLCEEPKCLCESSRDCTCKLQPIVKSHDHLPSKHENKGLLQPIVDEHDHLSFEHENKGLLNEPALLGILGKLHEPIIKQIACGYRHSLVLLSNGTIIMWGENVGSMNAIPSDIQGRVITIAGSQFLSVALLNDNTICIWNDDTKFTISDFGDRIVKQITTSLTKLVVLLNDGSLREWRLDYANLARGRVHTLREFRVISNFRDTKFPDAKIIQIGTQTNLSVGLLDNGAIKIWEIGTRQNGEYVRIYYDEVPVPDYVTRTHKYVQVHEHVTQNVKQIACGNDFSIALLKDGSIYGWGIDDCGSVSATYGYSKKDVKQIACGGSFSLVLFNDGFVEVLAMVGHMSIPVALARRIQGHVVQIACGYNHALVSLDDDTVAGWYMSGTSSHKPCQSPTEEMRDIPDKIRGF